jgi:hypothetical protein
MTIQFPPHIGWREFGSRNQTLSTNKIVEAGFLIRASVAGTFVQPLRPG